MTQEVVWISLYFAVRKNRSARGPLAYIHNYTKFALLPFVCADALRYMWAFWLCITQNFAHEGLYFGIRVVATYFSLFAIIQVNSTKNLFHSPNARIDPRWLHPADEN